MPPRLDEKGLGDPIKSGEEIAEAEPEPDQGGAFEPRAELSMVAVTAVEQPDERPEGQEQNRPEMQRREGEQGERAESRREKGTAPSFKARDPSGAGGHDAALRRPPERGGESQPRGLIQAVGFRASRPRLLSAGRGCAAS